MFNNFRFDRHTLLIILVCAVSCASRQEKYLNRLRDNLQKFDNLNALIVSRYKSMATGNPGPLDIYPHKNLHGNFSRQYDSSIYGFCKDYDINVISLKPAANNAGVEINYLVFDNNVQYRYNSKGIPRNTEFENTRVKTVPVSDQWQFVYEKPAW